MDDREALRRRVEELEGEVRALEETKSALVRRVERALDEVGSAFHLFESNILLQRRVEERTAALSHANEELRREIESSGQQIRVDERNLTEGLKYALALEQVTANANYTAAALAELVAGADGQITLPLAGKQVKTLAVQIGVTD